MSLVRCENICEMTGAIIQARMGSTRLPGKVMMEIDGIAVLSHVIRRLKKSRLLDRIIVTTTTGMDDAVIWDTAIKEGVGFSMCYNKDHNVLMEYLHAADKYKLDTIVRITADCPLVDPALVDECIKAYQCRDIDYLYGLPDGFDTEIFSYKWLKRAYEFAEDPSDKEHVTPYIRKYARSIYIGTPQFKTKLSIDTEEDLERIRGLWAKLPKDFTIKDVQKLVK